jgi:hypothetical protein
MKETLEEEITHFKKGIKYIQQDDVVLLGGDNETNGTVIADPKKMWGIGYYAENWNPKSFKILQEEQERTISKEAYEDSLNMQRCSNAGYENKISELENKIKQMYSEEDLKEALYYALSVNKSDGIIITTDSQIVRDAIKFIKQDKI